MRPVGLRRPHERANVERGAWCVSCLARWPMFGCAEAPGRRSLLPAECRQVDDDDDSRGQGDSTVNAARPAIAAVNT